MKEIKRIVSLILCVAFFSLIPICARAADAPDTKQLPARNGVTDAGYYIDISGVEYFVPVNTVLYQGMSSNSTTIEYVKIAQRALNNIKSRFGLGYSVLSVDGLFGSNTAYATVAFQQWWNDNLSSFYGDEIDVDGIVGNDTWRRFVTVCL